MEKNRWVRGVEPKRKPAVPALSPERRASLLNPGDDLLFHTVTRAVPSALEGLTSVFGMGTGVAPPLRSPGNLLSSATSELEMKPYTNGCGKSTETDAAALDNDVPTRIRDS